MATLRRHSTPLVTLLTNVPTRLLAFSLALILVLSTALMPHSAYGETTEIDAEPTTQQSKIEQTATDYNEAVTQVEALEAQIEETRTKLETLEEALPDQRGKSDQAFKALYKMQQENRTFIELILSSETIDDFFMTIEYLDRIQKSNLKEINSLKEMKAELEASEQSLIASKAQADAEKTHAETALKDAQAARVEAERKALEEQKAEQAEAERIKAEQAKQEDVPAKEETTTPDSGAPDSGSTPENPDWSSDKKTFIDSWGIRIDAYLAGSPLAGQGRTFAEASWDYGVDPRWSPAISNTESSKGLNCYASYNAWGWGGISWSSWEEAIDAHVRGLARGYGYTISIDAAKKYCPPNWEHWYNVTSAQMDMI